MRIIVDVDRCEGHGLCAMQAPEAFALDDDGELIHHFEGGEVPDGSVADVRAAIDACPVAALREAP